MIAAIDWSLWGAFVAGGIVGTFTTMTVIAAIMAAEDVRYTEAARGIEYRDLRREPDDNVRVIGQWITDDHAS